MKRIRNLSRGAWMVVGMVVTLVLVPTVAVAATATLVTIKGVGATQAKQLLSVEAAPVSYATFDTSLSALGSPQCVVLFKNSTAQGFVLKELQFDPFETADQATVGGTHASNAYASVFVEPVETPCTTATTYAAQVELQSGENVTVPLDPGITVPVGYQLTLGAQGANVAVIAHGYNVPSADAPAPAIAAHPGAVTGRIH